jgi:hypothetical protein
MAAGYAVAALSPGRALARIELCNVGAVILGVLVVLALFTPLLDPARISVASQVARLHAGQVTPEQFDFAYLRFAGGRYGAEALATLKSDPSPEVRDRAIRASQLPHRRDD